MKNKFTLLIATLLMLHTGYSQTNNFWKKNTDKTIKIHQQNTPFNSYYLDFDKLKKILSQSPKQGEILIKPETIVTFPNKSGVLKEYKMIEKSNLNPDLAKKFPSIKSYSGIATDGSRHTIHINLNFNQLNGVITKPDNTQETFGKQSNSNKNLYSITSITEEKTNDTFKCGVHNERNLSSIKGKLKKVTSNFKNRNANDGILRTYRFALATTAEFSQFYINRANVINGTNQQKKAAVLAGLNEIMTNINAVYERDLSVRFQLVANNDAIIFLNSNTDGLTSGSSSTLINEAHDVITNSIGNNSFDLGHVLDLSNTGGFGGLGVICDNSRKGKGVSTANDPTGNFFYGLFLHEIGHQLGANHTFNNYCNGNRVNTNAIEPGSGSSIMSYSGVCAPNVINDRDTYFHAKSIEEMWNIISNTNCETRINTGNSSPTANAGKDYVIPKSTPFVLKGSSSDVNNSQNNLTYTWEQMDIGIEAISPYAISGPAFRSLPPSSTSERYFPAISGVSSGFVSQWESLPAVSREMNFRFTVRDNNNGGASTNSDNTKITINDNAGPFVVTFPNSDQIIWTPGTNQNITWNVAGTNSNDINAAFVDILLSTDGGITFNTTLASNVPNDGLHQITVPNITGNLNRIMVRGTNHIFYDISNKNFFISDGSDTTAPSTPTGLVATNPDNNSHISANLNWTASTDNVGVAGYIIVQNGEEIFTWNSQNTSITMRGLDDGTEYTFQIIAFDAAGNRSNISTSATIKTTGNAPTAPKNVIATNVTKTGVTLNWDPSTSSGTNIDGYSVFVNGVFTLYTKNETPNNLTFAQLTTLDPDRTYSITVGAVDGNNIRSRRNSVPIEIKTLEDNTPPSTPTNLTATVPQSQNENPQTAVDLTWTASTDDTRIGGYIIVQNDEEVFTWNNQSTAITMRSLTPGTQYTFQIIAFDAAGNRSSISNSASITTEGSQPNDTTPPSNVTNLQVTDITQTTANLNWTIATDNVGVTGYDIFRNNETTPFQTSTTNSFLLTNLTPNTTTTYFVKAKDAAGNSSINNSNTVTVKTLPPTNTSYCEAGNRGTNYIAQVTLGSINNSSGNNAYSDYTTTQSTTVSKGQSITLTITPGISSSNWNNNVVAAWIDWNQNNSFDDPNERVLLKTRGIGGETKNITVPNDALSGATRLRVRYKWYSNPNPCGTSSTDGDEVEDYTINVIDSNTDTTPPSNVTNLQVTDITQTTANLNWTIATDNVGVTGYDIFRNNETTPFQTSTTNSFLLTNLTPNTTTTYFVKAKDAAGNSSINNSNTVTVKTLPPTNTSYCEAGNKGTNYIAQVTLGSINNSSGNNAYSDYTTTQTTTVSKGQSITLTITPGISSSNWNNNVVAAWIDWNQNNSFDDPNERVLLKTRGIGGETKNITVPNDALSGATRLRVRYKWYSNPNPCGTSSTDGDEVEDYTINVIDSNTNFDVFNSKKNRSTLFPNPFNESFILDVTHFNKTKFEISIYDIVGRIIYHKKYNENQNKIENLGSHINVPGNYFLRIHSNQKTEILKIIKK
ncbi:fibronectin type III domain-containing protein [Tenacibaculum sp. ZS6-P6]|uniref:fibronectin type III domain-containing protein n=1 Tax=Tenacibaculum sp. ZS6-P6 TaxID=3447503 RepID=UPI003F9B0129